MCLGVPMRIIAINGFDAECEALSVCRTVSLFMLDEGEARPGEYVMVHIGYALRKMSEAEAQTAWQLLDEIFAAEVS